MIKFLVTAAFVLVFAFLFVLLLSVMLWVVIRVLRSLFPAKFAPDERRKKDDK